ncbi:MAG: hypothetical protein LC721_05415, partial [Actinobacteria bacterium]|nr:hypothetical protein [Actinomycetota bacterium]
SQDTRQQLLTFAGFRCCGGGRCAAGTVLARQDGIRPAAITRSKAQLPRLAHRQPLSTLVVWPPAPGKVIPRLFVNHENLIDQLVDHQQIRGVGVLFPRLPVIALGLLTLDLTRCDALLCGR